MTAITTRGAVAAIGFAGFIAFSPPPLEAAGKPKAADVFAELRISGGVQSLPDHTAEIDSDQCRKNGLDGSSLVQRKTTLDLTALNLGIVRKTIRLDFETSPAEAPALVIFSFWLTKNCQLLVPGHILSGRWPLPAGSPGQDLVVIIPAGTSWTYNKVGGGAAECSGSTSLSSDVLITVRRNDSRTGDVCDCPFDYTDSEAALCP